ncbi:7-cyano-7-deazaguanine synthase [bacterium]|nr:7-cyano-7-deazaguanine synthase [bacterium]
MYNEKELSYFISCGYLPILDEKPLNQLFGYDFDALNLSNSNSIEDESIMIDEGVKTLRACFEDLSSKDHVIPLSGGLDSRLIIASLLESGIQDRIQTVTYGQPGAYNYEIAVKLAKKLGLKHKTINLNKIKIDTESLLQTAKNGGSWTWLIDAFYNSIVCHEYGNDVVYWSGFMGDPLAGSHLPIQKSRTWDEAKSIFVKWNNLNHFANLPKLGLRLEDCLPETPIIDSSVLSFDEQIDFAIRQKNYIKRVVLVNNFKFRTPFTTPKWVEFTLSLPRELRFKRYLFNKIALSAYPKIFKLPTEGYLGAGLHASDSKLLIRRALNKSREIISNVFNKDDLFKSFWESINVFRRVNYVDFQSAINNRKDYRETIQENLADLKKRHIVDWVNLDEIYRQYRDGSYNNSLALLFLTSLEISLKAEEEQSEKRS